MDEEVKAFDDSKAGVKGLVDKGVLHVPKFFIQPADVLNSLRSYLPLQIPVIDLQGGRKQVVDAIKNASENWGFFQVVNHGVPASVMDEMVRGVRRFHEEEDEMKRKIYSRDTSKRVMYSGGFVLYQRKAVNWKDVLTVQVYTPDPLDPNELPAACREIIIDYAKHVQMLGDTLFELISEALGLQQNHLKELNWVESCIMACNYYPPCPQPELVIGTAEHKDPSFLTILLQDNIGGLQVLYHDQWVDIKPIPGAFVINIGDLLQVVTNNKFRSVEHRVLVNQDGPRVSIASLLAVRLDTTKKTFGPIKELLSDEDGPVFRDMTTKDCIEFLRYPGEKARLNTLKL